MLQFMAFDYLFDLFGKNRYRKTRFSDVEQRTLMTIYNHVHRQSSDEVTIKELSGIRKEFYNLMNVEGQITFDEDTPLWLNRFLGYQFDKWSEFQLLKKHFREHPIELEGETAVRFEKICQMGYDQDFKKACKNILKEHPMRIKKLI